MSRRKQWLALVLSTAMVVQMFPVMTFASEGDDDALLYRDAVAGGQEMIDENPNGLLELANGSFDLREGNNGQAELVILRRGGTQGTVSATLKVVDISAQYNLDYKIKEGLRVLQKDAESIPYVEQFVDQENMASFGDDEILDINLLSTPLNEEAVPEDISEILDYSGDQADVGEAAEQNPAPAEEEIPANGPSEEDAIVLTSQETDEEETTTQNTAQSSSLREMRDQYFGNVSDRPENLFRGATGEEQSLYANGQQRYFDDAEGVSIPIVFEDGEYCKRFTISIINDDVFESEEQAIFGLTDITGANRGSLIEGYLNISDNDEAETAAIHVNETVYADFAGGFAEVVFTRTGALETYTVVTVESRDGTAKAGVNYEPVKTNIIFVPGATTRSLSVPLNGEGNLDFTLELSAKGEVEFNTNTVTVSDTAGQNQVSLFYAPYDESFEGMPVSTYLAGTFGFTGWGSAPSLGAGGQPYYFNGKYGSVNRGGFNFFGYSTLEWAWNNSAKSDFSKVDLNRADGTVVRTVKNRTDKFKDTKYERTTLTDNDQRNASVIDFATDGKNGSKSKMNVFWAKLYKTPYRIVLDNNVGTNGGSYLKKTDLQHERYTWTGVDKKTSLGWNSSGSLSLLSGADQVTEFGPAYFNQNIGFCYSAADGVYLAGVKLAKDNVNDGDYKYLELSDQNSVKLTQEFIKEYYDYGRNVANPYTNTDYVSEAHEYEFRGVFERTPSQVTIKSNGEQGYVEGFTTSSKSSATIAAAINDKIQINLVTVNGYIPTGIYVTRDGTREFVKAAPENAYTYLVEVDHRSMEIEPAFTQPGIRVAPDSALLSSGLFSEIKKGDIFTILKESEKSSIKVGAVDGESEPGNEGNVLATTNTQAGQYNIELQPVILDTEYLFNSRTQDAEVAGQYYTPLWTDATGILDLTKGEVPGNISEYRQYLAQNDPERYKDMITGVFGSSYAFTPRNSDAAIYYQFATMANAGIFNRAGGKVTCRNVSVFAKDGGYQETYLPAEGATVMLNGFKDQDGNPYSTTVDADGKFSFEGVVNMTSGLRYSATISYNGTTKTTFVVGGSSLLEYKLDPYEIMNPTNMQIFTSSGENALATSIAAGSMYCDSSHYSLVFDVYSNEGQIQPKDAYVNVYSRFGSKIATYKAEELGAQSGGKPTKSFMVSWLCPTNLRNAYPGYSDDIAPERPTSDLLSAGAYLTIQTVGSNDQLYPEVKTGIKFLQSLNPLNQFLINFNRNRDSSADIPIFGETDADVGIDVSIAESKETLEKNGYAEDTPFFEDSFDDFGVLSGKEARFGMGMTLTLGANNLTLQSADDAEVATMIMNADAEGIQQMAASGVDAATSLTQPAPILAGSQLLFQFGIRCRLAYDDTKDTWAFESLLGIAYCQVNLGEQQAITQFNLFGIPLIAKLGIGGSVYGIISCGVDPKTTFIPVNDEGLDIMSNYNNDSDWAMQLYLSGAIRGSFGLGIQCLHVALSVEADIGFDFYSFKAGAGQVNLKLGYSMRLLLMTIQGNFLNKPFEIYSYNYTNAASNILQSASQQSDELLQKQLSELKPLSRDYLDERSEWSDGGAVMLSSDSENSSGDLLKGVYPYSGNRLADISIGGSQKAMLVFEDDIPTRSDNNRTGLFFRTFDGTAWDAKQMVAADDGTADYEFSVSDLGDRLVVCWENAKEPVEEEASVDQTLTEIEIKAAIYDKETGAFGSAFSVISDGLSNRQPKAVDLGSGRIAFLYSKTDYGDISQSGTEALIGDYLDAFTVLAYRIYNSETGEFESLPGVDQLQAGDSLVNTQDKLLVEEEEVMETNNAYVVDGNGNEVLVSGSDLSYKDKTVNPTGFFNQAISLKENPGTDPYIVEYDIRQAERDGEKYGVIAYTIDEDGDLETTYDRPVYLKTLNLTAGESKPVLLTNNGKRNAALQFTSLNGVTMLVWIADQIDEGNEVNNTSSMCYVPIPLVIKNLSYYTGPDETRYPYINKGENSDGQLVKTLLETEGADTMTYFRAQAGGNDILLSWVVNEPDEESSSNVLHAMRIIAETEAGAAEPEDEAVESADITVSYTEPFAFRMESGEKASVSETDLMYFGDRVLGVWNKVESDDPGTDTESTRTQKFAVIQPQSRLVMDEVTIEGRPLAGNTVTVGASVQNQSFTNKDGNVKIELFAVKDGVATSLGSKISKGTRLEQGRLSGGDTLEIKENYKLPQELEGILFKAVVTADDGTELQKTKDLEVESNVTFSGAPATKAVSREELQVAFRMVNNGNKNAESGSIVTISSGNTLLKQTTLGALDIDETEDGVFSIPITDSMFTEKTMDAADGYTETIPLTLECGNNRISTGYSRNLPAAQADAMDRAGKPVFARTSISLQVGESMDLKADTKNGMTPDAEFIFTSSDPNVATVNPLGVVKAVNNGRATISAVLKPARTAVIMEGELAALESNQIGIPARYLTVTSIPVAVGVGFGGGAAVPPASAEDKIVVNGGVSSAGLSGDTVQEALDDGKSVVVKTTNGEVDLDAAALTAIAEVAKGEKVTILLERITEDGDAPDAVTEAATDGMLLNLKVLLPGGEVKDFKGGVVTVRVPVSDELADKEIKAVFIDEKGKKTTQKGRRVTIDGREYYEFVTGHFSYYAIVLDRTAGFSDVAGHWALDSIDYVVEKELFKGISDTLFAPGNQMTRGMVATVLSRMDGHTAEAGESNFTDVAADRYYSDAVAWAAENKIVTGFADGTFRPEQNVTRAEFAAMLYRYEKYKGYDSGAMASRQDLAQLCNIETVGEWALDGLSYMVGNEIMQGNSQNQLLPDNQIIRAEAAAMLERFNLR